MSEKAIRIWNGNRVVQVITVGEGSWSAFGGVGGAHNGTKIDIEIDPWAGLIHTNDQPGAPIYYGEVQRGE